VEMNDVADEMTEPTNQKMSDIRRSIEGCTYMGECIRSLRRSVLTSMD
jgi:hypothetical protein